MWWFTSAHHSSLQNHEAIHAHLASPLHTHTQTSQTQAHSPASQIIVSWGHQLLGCQCMHAWTCARSSCTRSGRRSRTVDTMHGRAICTRIDDWVTHAAADRSRDVTHVPWLIAARASCIKDGGSHAKWGRSPPWSARDINSYMYQVAIDYTSACAIGMRHVCMYVCRTEH